MNYLSIWCEVRLDLLVSLGASCAELLFSRSYSERVARKPDTPPSVSCGSEWTGSPWKERRFPAWGNWMLSVISSKYAIIEF